jgi:ribosomal-protein-alanine N-acetyltransferase
MPEQTQQAGKADRSASHDWRIRLAARGESAQLADLHAQAFDKAWSAREMAGFLTDPVCGCLVAERQGGEAAGFVLVRAVAGEAEILTLAVVPRWRQRGGGQRLMQAAIAWAAEHEARTVYLEAAETNIAALSVYRNLGFVAAGYRRDYYASGGGYTVGAIVFALEIPA